MNKIGSLETVSDSGELALALLLIADNLEPGDAYFLKEAAINLNYLQELCDEILPNDIFDDEEI